MMPLTGLNGTRTRVVVVASAFLVAVVTGAWLLDRGSRTGAFTAFEAAHLFDQVFDHVSRDYVETVPDSALYAKAVAGMLYELHDPYAVFLPQDRLARLSEVIAPKSTEAAGVGLDIDMSDASILVLTPAPGGPAERAGVLPDDRIMRIDGKSTDGWTKEEALQATRGRAGSNVTLQLDRPGAPKPINVILTRQPAGRTNFVREAMLPDGVGYLGIGSFGDSIASEVPRLVETLLGRGMTSLILDLRSNAAGSLSQGLAVSDLFLNASQPIVAVRGRAASSERVFTDSTRERWPALLLAVLVDGRSAGAAEVIAGALQDHDRAAIVGRPTYGMGSQQAVFPAGGPGGVRLTIARWFSPSGRQIGKPAIDEEDEDEVNAARLQQHEKFRTDSGRAVYGVGEIVPDVLAGDTVPPLVDAAFARKLGSKTGIFRDALTAYAKDLKARRAVTSPDFAVTRAMLEELWRRLDASGLLTDRTQFDQAQSPVSQLLGYEIARTAFGVDAEFRRRSESDAALGRALRLVRGAKTERDLLRRAASAGVASDSTGTK